MAMTAYILNLFDLFCTLYAISIGATELNPLMRCVPVLAAYKLAVVGALLWWLCKRQEAIAKRGLGIITVVYAVLNAYHLVCMLWLATTP